MATKVATTKIKGGADYAKVADRLNEFRSTYPRSKISIKVKVDSEGNVTHMAYIWKDKTECYELLKSGVSAQDVLESADAEGSSFMNATKIKTEKGYEKNETIAIGRALAIAGYATSGEVASSEEMEEFEDFKNQKAESLKASVIEMLGKAKTIKKLQAIWLSLDGLQRSDEDIIAKKDEMKEILNAKPATVKA